LNATEKLGVQILVMLGPISGYFSSKYKL